MYTCNILNPYFLLISTYVLILFSNRLNTPQTQQDDEQGRRGEILSLLLLCIWYLICPEYCRRPEGRIPYARCEHCSEWPGPIRKSFGLSELKHLCGTREFVY